MREIWDRLQSREKQLIQGALVLLLAAFVFQAGVIPLLKSGDAARERLVLAEGTISRLQRLKVAGISQVPQPRGGAEDPAAVAEQLGLVLSSPAVASGGSLQFQFADAEPSVVFSWMERIESGTGLTLISVEMVSVGQGRVNATVAYAGAAQQ